jgi:hypothetical protein
MFTDYETLTLEQLHELKTKVGPAAQEKIQEAILRKAGNVLPSASRRRKSGIPEDLQREDEVENDVIVELEALGFDVVKLSQHGRPKGMTEGIPDLYARHVGRRLRVWIEVKQATGDVRPEQKRWHKTERDAGGEVWTVWCLRDLREFLTAKGFAVVPV